LRLFPNWPKNKDATFWTLRAVGAFLVSAELKDGEVKWIEVRSEAGGRLDLINPWTGAVRIKRKGAVAAMRGTVLSLPTEPGETIQFRRP
jgi:alpha-L-fucosidase 2